MKINGFTLLELMVSLLIFSIVSLGIGGSFSQHMTMSHQGEIKSMAAQAAQRVLDNIRYSDPATLPTSGSDPVQNISIGNKTYEVTASYCENSAYCGTNNIRHITVRVEHKNEEQYEVQTVFTQLR